MTLKTLETSASTNDSDLGLVVYVICSSWNWRRDVTYFLCSAVIIGFGASVIFVGQSIFHLLDNKDIAVINLEVVQTLCVDGFAFTGVFCPQRLVTTAKRKPTIDGHSGEGWHNLPCGVPHLKTIDRTSYRNSTRSYRAHVPNIFHNLDIHGDRSVLSQVLLGQDRASAPRG